MNIHRSDITRVTTVIVTYNRKDLLKRCLDALLRQSYLPETILIMDNASTDGTQSMLKHEYRKETRIRYQNLGRNIGGAGGFHYGALAAVALGAEWVWMMDDDCLPDRDCLKNLLASAKNTRNIYAPIVLSIEDRKTPLWGVKAKPDSGVLPMAILPFNGFLIHTNSIKKIGPPEKNFFIYGDDAEYNFRARKKGSRTLMVTSSRLYHPFKNNWKDGRFIIMFTNQIWVYYKLRNAIILYQKYGYYSTKQLIMLLAAFFTAFLTLRFDLIKLWFAAIVDGSTGRIYLKEM